MIEVYIHHTAGHLRGRGGHGGLRRVQDLAQLHLRVRGVRLQAQGHRRGLRWSVQGAAEHQRQLAGGGAPQGPLPEARLDSKCAHVHSVPHLLTFQLEGLS